MTGVPGADLLLLMLLLAVPSSRPATAWEGTWTIDLCHEDRKGEHDADQYCREGLDRIVITREAGGAVAIKRCPSLPWRLSRVRIEARGQTLRFRTPEGLDVQLHLEPDATHYRGRFRSSDGHAGRVSGRRMSGCG